MPNTVLDRASTATRAQTVAPPAGRRRGVRTRDRTFAVMIALPAVSLFLVVAIYPLISSVGTSLYDQSLLRPERTFTGTDNYSLVWPQFLHRLVTTLVFSGLATVFPVLLGVTFAVLLSARLRGRNMLRGVVMLPWLLPGVVVSFLWAWIFNDNYGVINSIFDRLGLGPISPLDSPVGAMFAVVLAKTWQSFPWVMAVALAALQTLPREQLEAAAIDGATRAQRFRYISLPHLVGPVTLVAVLEFVYNFGSFDTIFVMTGGGPGDATTTLAVDLYRVAFGSFQLGQAAALGVLWLALLMVISSGYLLLNRRLEKR